jgi:hypothetical protein
MSSVPAAIPVAGVASVYLALLALSAEAGTMNQDHIVRHLVMSGWTPQSIEAVRPQIPRWLSRLGGRDIRTDPQAESELDLLMLQATKRRTRRQTDQAHHLRNILGWRPWHR